MSLLSNFFRPGKKKTSGHIQATDNESSNVSSPEFLIKRTDGEWFDHPKQNSDIYPTGATEVAGQGDYRIKLGDAEVEINYEDPGYHVIFHNFSGTKNDAEKVVTEMSGKIQNSTGQAGQVINLS